MRRALPLCLLLTLAACSDSPSPEPVSADAKTADAKAADAKAADAKATDAKATDTKAADAKAGKKPRKPVDLQPTYESQLAAVDRLIKGQTKVTVKNSRSFMAFGKLASLYMMRARLTGDYADYGKAEDALTTAFEVGPKKGFGPFMVRARLNYTLHRLDRVDADFDMATKLPTRDGRERFRRAQFAGNLAFQRGEYDDAKKFLEASLTLKENLSALSALAVYRWKTGEFDEAEQLFERAMKAHKGKKTEPKAWVHLQLGLMDLDRGRYEEALAHYREGEALIKGYWLIEEHIAEILTLTGKTEEAKALYREIIERTDNPEFMDSMAGIALEAGDQEGAKAWINRARARYEAQMERFPEAAYGHALEHYLEFGDDPAVALDMAQKNHALRPNADAKRLLAEAHLAAGQAKDARPFIDQALASPVRNADLHATAAAVYETLGKTAKAQKQRELALAINPKIELGSEEASEDSPADGATPSG